MSITIADILKLPSMEGGRVVAGAQSIERVISSVTVLENDDPTLFKNQRPVRRGFAGNEIVITGFINNRNDVEKQCESVRKISEDGEAGIILFYVGIAIPFLDKRVIELANQLGLPLICMPENRIEQRYSEVICEIMDAIIKDEMADSYFASGIMEQISKLPKHLRNMDSVLRLLRDKIRCSIFIADMSGNLLNIAAWPSGSQVPVREILSREVLADKNKPYPITIEGKQRMVNQSWVTDEKGIRLHLVTLKDAGGLTPDICRQINEVVQTFLNIWSEKHGAIEPDELVKAILNDEPVKMRRMAELLKIDVTEFSTMWVFSEKTPLSALEIIGEFLSVYSNNFVVGIYEENIVAFIDKCAENDLYLAEQLFAELDRSDSQIKLTLCSNLNSTAEARQAFLTNERCFSSACIIYSEKSVFTYSEINFADHCCRIVGAGDDEIRRRMNILRPIAAEDKNGEFLETLQVYVLDCQCNMAATAEKMFVHKNTIKYRISRLKKLLGHDVDRVPELQDLYIAAALERLMKILKA